MFTSTIIPTIARDSLARAVESVLAQDFSADDFEVVVVNDSGRPLPAAPWQSSRRVRILDTMKRERCFARNAGASVATGRYLHFLDDDDWLLPGALAAFWAVARANSAAWIYGSSRYLGRHEHLLAEHHVGVSGNGFVQAVAGEWIPLQASVIRSDAFFAAGGFDPRFLASQDKDLCRKVAFQGELANTPAPVACLLRDRQNSTTNYALADRFNTWSRDDVLARSGAFARMRGSVTDAYWAGKLVRAYLTCTWWNLRQGKILNALGRGLLAAAGFAVAGFQIFHPAFWRAVLNHHRRENIF